MLGRLGQDTVTRSGLGWVLTREGATLRASFEGTLTASEGERSAAALRELVRDLEGVDIVLHVRDMEGFDTAARKAWQRELRPLRARIRSLRTVGASPIVRLGASTLGLLVGIPVDHD